MSEYWMNKLIPSINKHENKILDKLKNKHKNNLNQIVFILENNEKLTKQMKEITKLIIKNNNQINFLIKDNEKIENKIKLNN